ncbi:MAG: hypothetical protein LBC49_02425, partial [Bacteroidales bacterium]|nr:hypothetical protein [Bacteroidales bacterium]
MKKIVLLLASVVITGSSLFAQRIDLRSTQNQTIRTDQTDRIDRTAQTKASNTKGMTWTEITLPFSEMVTYDTAHCELFGGYFYGRGFYFTLTEPSRVVISGPRALAYNQLYTSQAMDSSLDGGYALYQTLEPGTYYFLSDDNGALFFGDYGGEPLTTRIEVYTVNGTYKSYTELQYSQLLEETQPVSGQLQDTLLMFPITIQIAQSTETPYYMNIEDGESYEITFALNSTDPEGFAGGVYVLNSTLSGEQDVDILGSAFVASAQPERSMIYTASYTGIVKILPFSFANGVSYEISV